MVVIDDGLAPLRATSHLDVLLRDFEPCARSFASLHDLLKESVLLHLLDILQHFLVLLVRLINRNLEFHVEVLDDAFVELSALV